MAVNWTWKYILGYTYYKVQIANTNEYKTYRNTLYGGRGCNCLAVEIYHNDKEHYTFQGFWNDTTHLANCLGLTKQYKDNIYIQDWKYITKIKLNTYFFKDTMAITKYFAMAHIKVELYYKEVK